MRSDYPTITDYRRLGSIPGCIALGAADLGVATVDGHEETITWGRGLSRQQANWPVASRSPAHSIAGSTAARAARSIATT